MVRAGYKETEIGVIPAEWELCSIEHDFDFYPNNTYARDCMNDASGAVRNIHYGDVLIKYGAILDCAADSIPFLNLGIAVNTVNRTVQSGDIIMADTAEDETVGKATEVVNVGNKRIVAGLHTYFLRPHADLFAPRFLGYFINSAIYHNQLLPHIVGTKVSSISKKGLNETIVLRPTLPEQHRIAEVLSDIDALIANLEKMIVKKRAIKQGTMQLLVTGKKRLPGFTGEWVEKRIDELVEQITTGLNPRNNFTLNVGGTNFYVTIKNFFNGRIFLDDNCDRITTEAVNIINARSDLRKDDILFSSIGRIGDAYLITATPKDWNINESVFSLRPRKDIITPLYFYYLLRGESVKQALDSNSTGSTLTSIKQSHLKAVQCSLPSDINEQAAIASILFDMDREIDELSKRLVKSHNIKIGMMQALLTGRIRLTEQVTPAVVIPFPKAKAQPKQDIKSHNRQFDDAVAIAAIVNAFYSDKYPLGRKKVQKLLYLLRRRQDASTAAFKKKAAGPYADEVRYKDGEPIAKRNGYVTVESSNQGSKFAKGKNIGKALDYIAKWDMQPDIDWLVSQFLYTNVDRLELLATIDMAMCDLEGNGITASVDSVKELIASDKEWRAKLKKAYFSDDDIGWAITECLGLFNTTGR